MFKPSLFVVTKINYKDYIQCWGCRDKVDEEINKFCLLQNQTFLQNQPNEYGLGSGLSICMGCFNYNVENKLASCINCSGNFLLDFTKLKINDKLKYGTFQFFFCYNCLKQGNNDNTIFKKCIYEKCNLGYGRLDLLDNEKNKWFDTWTEEYEEPEFKHLNDKSIRIIGQTIYDFNAEKNNIKKKISNCVNKDKKKFNLKGNMTYANICNLLKNQNYECYVCNEKVLTEGYKPYCVNQFSIDRIDDNKPHNDDNVKISCYFCNCKDHYLFDKKNKICDIDGCNCKITL